MKKSSFVALLLGVVSGFLFAIGMCMALLPQWNAFKPGVIFGVIGIVMGIITLLIWRKMEGKSPIKMSKKGFFAIVLAIVGALLLGVGMCFCLVWNNLILGTLIGLVGIIALLFLIPLCKGLN